MHGERVHPALAYLVAGCLYAGFQLTVRVLVYPQMALVPATAWARYELAHQRRVSLVVGPLFALQLITTGVLVTAGDTAPVGRLAAVVLLGLLLALTAFGAAPAHGRLSQTFSESAYLALLRWDTCRVVLAVAQVALGLVTVAVG